MENIVENKRSLLSLPPLVSQKHTPGLILSHGVQGEKQTFFSISQDQYYTRMIPEMENKIILGSSSSSGWLILMDDDADSSNYFLLNLESLEKIQLPFDMDYPDHILMTATPPSGHIVFIQNKDNEKCTLQFYCPDDNQFCTQTLDFCLGSAAASNGKIFCLKNDWSIVIIEIVGSNLQLSNLVVQQIPPMFLSIRGRIIRSLIEHLGEMLLVLGQGLSIFELPWHYDFTVFKLDSSAMAWVEVVDMGEYAIFIDNKSGGICAPCPPTDDEFGICRSNSVYHIPTLDEDEDHDYMYVFDLKEGCTAPYLPCPTLSRQYQSSRWVMLPSIKQLEDLKV
ncbi:hypothetical protein COLO4_22268 [Corchorus olitorius]|uniref:KIB1-4 beta-propeller domain-containing protein n=1 Tax=Corchorus olitorius TaxID=93759 RepID=A0A1R3INC6_9ROSI|nr:hypothetical protein COLO4_22268 [Corchorus olitorius]